LLVWISILLCTAVSVWYLARPLRLGPQSRTSASDADLDLFRTQILEIDEDLASGALTRDEADALRAEVGRRMLAISRSGAHENEASSGQPERGRKVAAIAITAVMPAMVLVLYLLQGSPHLPTKPYAVRGAERAAAAEQLEYAQALERLETVMSERPDDPKGWQLLAQGYANFGRYDDAANAYRKAIGLGSPTADMLSGLGESLTLRNNGVVTSNARQAFAQALNVNPEHVRSRYYLALDKAFRGKPDDATRELEQILDDPNVDSTQAEIIKEVVARLRRGELNISQTEQADVPRGPSAEDVAAAQTMDEDARQEMIEGMVTGLASRLEEDPSDADGWIMLVRSLRVLGREEAAAEALTKARDQFKDNPQVLSRFTAELTTE